MLLRDAALSRPPPPRPGAVARVRPSKRIDGASLLRRRRRRPQATTTRASSSPQPEQRKRVAVIGAGVAGLTSALRLQLAHPAWRVVVLADRLEGETTTSGAAGMWGPYKLSETPPADVLRWSRATYAHLRGLAHSAEAADAGVGRLRVTTLLTAAALRKAREIEGGGGGAQAEDEGEGKGEAGGGAPFLPYWADAVGGARAFSRVPEADLALYSSSLLNAAGGGGLPPLPAQLCRFGAVVGGGGNGGTAAAAAGSSGDNGGGGEAAAGAAPWGPDPHASPLVAGYTWPTAVCEGRLYLRWLARALRRAGGRVSRHRVASVAALASGEERVAGAMTAAGEEEGAAAVEGRREGEPRAEGRDGEDGDGADESESESESESKSESASAGRGGFDCVVDAAGLRAPELFPDDAARVYPIRGHVLRVRAPWLKEAVFAETGHNGGTGVYVIPTRDNVVIGGTGGVGDGGRAPRPVERAGVLRAALALVPSLARAEPVGEWVGLRPGRTRARVGEVEWVPAGEGAAAAAAGAGAAGEGAAAAAVASRAVPVVHNYGHGGSGLTLAWGCAADVVAAVEGALGVELTRFPDQS